jgi:hypothetical protein
VADEDAKTLQIYLNDHLAGAKAALDLIGDVLEGTPDAALEATLRDLRDRIEEDRATLVEVMARLGVEEQRTKQVIASLTESVSRVKLARAGAPEGLARLLELETLSAGIWTKMRLWLTLAGVTSLRDALRGIDLEELIARAERQLESLEPHRIATAEQTLER